MFARAVPDFDRGLAQWGPAVASTIAGAVYGLALARGLFELNPLALGLFGSWPWALLAGVAGAAAALGLSQLAQRIPYPPASLARWAGVALALPLVSLLAPDVNLLRSLTLLVGAAGLTLLLWRLPAVARSRTPAARILSLALFLFLFLLYLRTLAPAVGQADTFEFQVGIARLGIAHGSGYPLLMLLGRLFTLLPVGGTLAFRANLTSAFFGALAGVGVQRLTQRLGASPLVAVLAGVTFGVAPTLWARAVEVEVYTLNAAFVVAILSAALSFLTLPVDSQSTTPLPFGLSAFQTRLGVLAGLFGLSLTNHLTTLLLAPAVLSAVTISYLSRQKTSVQARHNRLASVIRPASFVLLAFLLGLSVYLYLPIRWPAVNNGQLLSLPGLLNILTGNEARGAFQWRLPFQDWGRYPIVWSKITGEFGWVGLLLTTLGAIRLAWQPRPTVSTPRPNWAGLLAQRYGVLICLALAYSGYLYFALAFNVPDPDFSAFFIPLHLIAAVLMGLGLQWLLNALLQRSPPPGPWASAMGCLLLTAFCLLPLASIWRTFPLVDHSDQWAGQQAGELMLGQPLAEHAAILADSEKIAPLDYLQIAEGQRPDLDIIVLPDEASYRAALDERLAAGQVVYLGRYLPGLGADYSLRSVGPLAEVSTTPFTSTRLAVTQSLAQIENPAIQLDGYATFDGNAGLAGAAPNDINLALVWQALSQPPGNLLVNLRLVNAARQGVWQNVGSVPVSGLYPTNAWRAGEVISDFYSLPVSASLTPGTYQLQVALLPPFAAAPETAWTPVAPVTILPPTQAPTPPHWVREQFGPNWLLGYDIPAAVAPGARYAVTLYWLQTSQSAGVPGPTMSGQMGEIQSIAAWPVGAVAPVQYQMTAPETGSNFSLAINSGAPARCGWLAPVAAACPLPAIQLTGQAAAEGAVNYDNQILLNQARLQTPQVAPGGTVSLALEWQALRAVSEDYTVFVHLIGPDGLVHGQIDQWPVSGTRATSTWAPGEHIADAYVVPVPADAPPGAYQVEIGLYLLATSERLPVLNNAGVPIDDRLLLSGLVIQPH